MKKEGAILLLLALILFFNLVSAGELKVTSEHPFLIEGNWVSANQLNVGDKLTLADGRKAVIKNIKRVVPAESFKVYNLETEKYNDFVVGNEGLVVHNSVAPKDFSELPVTFEDRLFSCAPDEVKRIYTSRMNDNMRRAMDRMAIDEDMRPILKKLWGMGDSGIRTSYSCSGHSGAEGYIALKGLKLQEEVAVTSFLKKFGFEKSVRRPCCQKFLDEYRVYYPDKLRGIGCCGNCGAGLNEYAFYRGKLKFPFPVIRD